MEELNEIKMFSCRFQTNITISEKMLVLLLSESSKFTGTELKGVVNKRLSLENLSECYR